VYLPAPLKLRPYGAIQICLLLLLLLDTDASDVAVGAGLSQKVDGVERPIAFFSRVMNSTQRNYCTTRRELVAVICAIQHFSHYLLGNKVVLRTDHQSLKWLQTFKRPEGILARWVETLAEFISPLSTDLADCIAMSMEFLGPSVSSA